LDAHTHRNADVDAESYAHHYPNPDPNADPYSYGRHADARAGLGPSLAGVAHLA
jgi:hypothetical protein